MEEAKDESVSFDETLLTLEIKNGMEELIEKIKAFPKKDIQMTCDLCSDEIKIHNLHDVFRSYALILSCLIYHTEHIKSLSFKELANVELFILKNLSTHNFKNVSDVLEYHRGAEDEYNEALKELLISTFNKFYKELSININCEEEVESLLYKYYILLDENKKREMSTKDVEILLFLLFKRNELVRFFKVFDFHGKTDAMIKLALILTIRPECHVYTDKLLRDLKEHTIVTDGHTSNELIEMFNDVGIVYKNEEDIKKWIEIQKEILYWEDCVKIWSTNRKDNMGIVDSSMLELCNKHERFEDGWKIFEQESIIRDTDVHKACLLCINAFKNTKSDIWIERIIEVIDRVKKSSDPSYACILSDDILTKIGDFPEEHRNRIVQGFENKIGNDKQDEKVVGSLLRGLRSLGTVCKNTNTCEICANFANSIYKNWKKNRDTKFLFFKKSGQYDTEIYSNMLEVFDAAEDCDGFNNVCKDLMRSNTDINKELCLRLEQFHNQSCEDCRNKKTQMLTRKSGKDFFGHFLNNKS